ncbi:hypothetical protein [Nostoc sp.]|uniref:hypothetical protein n=1 Tax=Nostoc sp. TaxID=1180 RepID=UPI002FF76A65
MDNMLKNAGLIFMKVGLHAQESIEDIIQRKQREFEEAGSIFWGYGGNTCHPLSMVQPFAKQVEKSGNEVLIVMQKMNSKHAAPPEIAKQYSDDGVNWQPIPKGIEVRGSRYALVLDQLRVEEFDVDLGELEVGVGPSRGRKADEYLLGRADKGCFFYQPRNMPVTQHEQVLKRIGLVAHVKAPYAVFLKN